MKRALFLSHVPPFPELGGDRIRIAQNLRLLTEFYDVDIAYMTNTPRSATMKSTLPRISNEFSFFSPFPVRLLRAAKTLFNGKSLEENLFLHPGMLAFVKKHASDYDLIFCASPVTAQYAGDCAIGSKVLDMTDSLTMNYQNAAGKVTGWRKYAFSIEASRLRNYELECRKNFRAVSYISEIDRDYLGKDDPNLFIVRNAVKEAGDKTHIPPVANRQISFVGKMNYGPNILAVTFFAKRVLPLIREKYPQTTFRIVGISPTESVRALSSIPGVEVTGFVDSITPWFLSSAIVVAPMLSGSGVQNKILQALSHNCAVMTTPIGLEGIENLKDVITVIPPDPESWSEAIVNAFDSPDEIIAKAIKASERVEEEFGMAKIRSEFRNFIEGGSNSAREESCGNPEHSDPLPLP